MVGCLSDGVVQRHDAHSSHSGHTRAVIEHCLEGEMGMVLNSVMAVLWMGVGLDVVVLFEMLWWSGSAALFSVTISTSTS